MNMRSALLLLHLAMACTLAPAARAAESYDNCTGFVTSLPTVISSQGTWCLNKDLATAISTGIAITINTNNVTIDCNDFKLGGLAAGAATQTVGIYANDRVNSTIRHCNIRGFLVGIRLEGLNSGGHLIEDNRFDGNTFIGMAISGEGSVIRNNRLFDTGETSLANTGIIGISTEGPVDIIGNSVAGVVAKTGSNTSVYGILTDGEVNGGRIIGNGVRGLLKDGPSQTYGIYNVNSFLLVLRNNDVYGDGSAGSVGLYCSSNVGRARDNEVAIFPTDISGCSNISGNDVY